MLRLAGFRLNWTSRNYFGEEVEGTRPRFCKCTTVGDVDQIHELSEPAIFGGGFGMLHMPFDSTRRYADCRHRKIPRPSSGIAWCLWTLYSYERSLASSTLHCCSFFFLFIVD